MATKRAPIPIAGVNRIIAVASGKGGVGKSTVAVNLAVALGHLTQPNRVGLLDADVHGPSVPKMLCMEGIKPQVDEHQRLIPVENFGVHSISMGYLSNPDDAIVWRGLMVTSALQKLMRHVAWAPLGNLVIDMPPGTGDAHLTLSQTTKLDGAIVVTTPQDVALIDASKAITMFRRVNVPLLGLVLNMSHHECPNCGNQNHIFGSDENVIALAKKSGVSVIARIPLDADVAKDCDKGRPVVLSQPHSTCGKEYAKLAERVLDIFR